MEDLQKQFSQIKSRATSLSDLAKLIRDKISKINLNIKKMKEYKFSSRIEDVAFTSALGTFADKAIIILQEEAGKALSSSKEFSYPPFANGLRKAIMDGGDGIILKKRGQNITTAVDMNRICGSINEYASAVKLARKELKIGKITSLNPDIGSYIWWEKIYGVFEGKSITKKNKEGKAVDITRRYQGKYERTISSRIGFFKSLAPWWQLLDKGNAGPSFPDSGGFPTPEQSPTNFVRKSEWRINSELYAIYETNLNKIRIKIQNKIDIHTKEIEFWQTELDKITGGVEDDRFKVARTELRSRVRNWQTVDFEKFEIIVTRLAMGERINPQSGVRLGRGNRIRVLAIANKINQLFGEL